MVRQNNRQDRHCAMTHVTKGDKKKKETDRYKKKTKDQKINPERYFSRILFVYRFSQIENLLFTNMRTWTDCQIDFTVQDSTDR